MDESSPAEHLAQLTGVRAAALCLDGEPSGAAVHAEVENGVNPWMIGVLGHGHANAQPFEVTDYIVKHVLQV